MSARETAALLLNRLVQAAGFVGQRRPAQWTRLGFFSRHLVFPDPPRTGEFSADDRCSAPLTKLLEGGSIDLRRQ
jgi:hypothetical protein